MRPGFFASKEFLFAVGLAIVLVAGAAWAFNASLDPVVEVERTDCHALAGSGAVRPTTVTDTGAQSTRFGVERVVTYVVNASDATNGTAFACSTYGDISIQPSSGPEARLIFTIHGGVGTAGAVDATGIDALARSTSGRLDVWAWQTTSASTRILFDNEGVGVHIVLELPAQAEWKLDVDTPYGDLEVVRMPVADGSKLDTKYGDVVVADVELRGGFTVDTSYGDVDFSATRVSTGRLAIDSSYGDLDVSLPRQADAGFDVRAETSYGESTVSIGETEVNDKNKDETNVHARTSSYATKTARLEVSATTSYGDVDVNLK